MSTGSDGSLSVEGISIITSDVEASNGVIHFIHQLLPDPDENASRLVYRLGAGFSVQFNKRDALLSLSEGVLLFVGSVHLCYGM